MKYFNTDTVANHFISLWEDSNDETSNDEESTVYEPDNNDDGFYDGY
jgi:hypothetical protein